jgi:hypothetical protein
MTIEVAEIIKAGLSNIGTAIILAAIIRAIFNE